MTQDGLEEQQLCSEVVVEQSRTRQDGREEQQLEPWNCSEVVVERRRAMLHSSSGS